MGQQQLLLIALGVIVVGIAVYVGFILFSAHTISSKRDLLVEECSNVASMAQQYYQKPKEFRGGNKSFTGWQIPARISKTETGQYTPTISADHVVISAVGYEESGDGSPIEVEMTVYADSVQMEVKH